MRKAFFAQYIADTCSPQCNEELDMQTLEFNDVVERFTYMHEQSQLQLQEALTHSKTQVMEAESQRRREEEARLVALNTRFPQSIEAYDQITDPKHKHRVSRLLVAPTTEEKEQIAAPFQGLNTPGNWTEADCTPLMNIFGSNVCFNGTCQPRILIWSTLDITASIRREGAQVHAEFTKHGPTQTTYGLSVWLRHTSR